MKHLRPFWHLELRPWPFWSQLADWTADGGPDENRLNNCGPECVAMCLRYLTGVELAADTIKDTLYGQGYAGYTNVPDLERFLEQRCETAAETILCTSARDQAWHEWRYLRRGRPLIGLFSFSAPGSADGHFRCVIGQDRRHVYTADPWTGSRRVETIDEHWAWSKGLLVGIERVRRLGGRPR